MLAKLTSDFDSFFENVLSTLYGSLSCDLDLVKAHFIRVSKYNVPNGKKVRGRICVAAFKCFAKGEASDDLLRLVNLVGWAIELVESAFLVLDDLIDGSFMRRGQISWGLLQQREGHGLIGINDGLHLYISVQQLLMAGFHSRPHPRCLEILKLFGDCANSTCFGQALDILSSGQLQSTDSNGMLSCEKPNSNYDCLRDATVSRFASIAKWKTSYYSFVLPVAAGMLLADVKSDVLFSNAESILLKIGEYFQMQDDFLDVYGDEKVTGKVGTDIEEGKCSWLIATALEKTSSEQRDALSKNYGLKDPDCVRAVRKVFDELDLPSLYSAYEDQSQKHILDLIKSVSTEKDEDFTDPVATNCSLESYSEEGGDGVEYHDQKYYHLGAFHKLTIYTYLYKGGVDFTSPNTMPLRVYSVPPMDCDDSNSFSKLIVRSVSSSELVCSLKECLLSFVVVIGRGWARGQVVGARAPTRALPDLCLRAWVMVTTANQIVYKNPELVQVLPGPYGNNPGFAFLAVVEYFTDCTTDILDILGLVLVV
ncbi:Farnesyl pyrophosphate synthase [Echinococcus granulosus]|uniref:Farnesyl pyrophosphate synthase n=1 Tax=Echinococcus granulosus TaxID=6210 RepID=W6V073_ECHGR|nr:Farnesyl pyrophosphate synthase [Echinococcus granulosus]EUB59369.1 Farnesyl pyrophosphate synthase [Echinococcus granulosus]